MALRFEWQPAKSASNRRKHGVSFEEAQTVFYDDNALLLDDPVHSEHEARFVLLRMSHAARALVVCHCYRGELDTIRITSARRANRHEQRQYKDRYGT